MAVGPDSPKQGSSTVKDASVQPSNAVGVSIGQARITAGRFPHVTMSTLGRTELLRAGFDLTRAISMPVAEDLTYGQYKDLFRPITLESYEFNYENLNKLATLLNLPARSSLSTCLRLGFKNEVVEDVSAMLFAYGLAQLGNDPNDIAAYGRTVGFPLNWPDAPYGQIYPGFEFLDLGSSWEEVNSDSDRHRLDALVGLVQIERIAVEHYTAGFQHALVEHINGPSVVTPNAFKRAVYGRKNVNDSEGYLLLSANDLHQLLHIPIHRRLPFVEISNLDEIQGF